MPLRENLVAVAFESTVTRAVTREPPVVASVDGRDLISLRVNENPGGIPSCPVHVRAPC